MYAVYFFSEFFICHFVKMQDITRKTAALKEQIDNLNEDLRRFFDPDFQPNTSKKTNPDRLHHIIIGHFQKSSDFTIEIIELLNKLINNMSSSSNNGNHNKLLDPQEIKEMVKLFFTEKIKIKTPPFSPYCGCNAYKNKKVKEGAFICARIIQDHKPYYFLYIIASIENGVCQAFDPTAEEIDHEIKLVTLQDDDWTPLPTIFPEKPVKRWEHTENSTVLSLFPESGEWTTEFYLATVIKAPCQRAESEKRGYELEFEDHSRYIVPEKFVVHYPENWKET